MEVDMKSNKWVGWTLGIVLGLVVLAGVGFAGFQLGAGQNANFAGMMPFGHWRGFGMHGGFRGHDFGSWNGFGFFYPIFFLIRLAIIGGLIWLGYALFKGSGWRLVKDAPSAGNDDDRSSA